MKQKAQQITNSNTLPLQTYKKRQSGFSLIEIMVAAIILSIGILGVVSLQVIGMKGTHQSYMKHQAMAIVQALTERMRSNVTGVTAGDYVQASAGLVCATPPPVCNTATTNCSAADIAAVDNHNIICGYQTGAGQRTGGLKITAANDIATLLNGTLDITCNDAAGAGGCANGAVTIRVGWAERDIGEETNTANAVGVTDFIVVSTRISP